MKVGRNEFCPCGSGKKFKRCCRGVALGYTKADRTSAFAKLEHFIAEELGQEDDRAFDEFWEQYPDDNLPEERERQSEDVFDMWFAFDRRGDEGGLVVDRFLKAYPDLSPGERLFLETLRGSSMHLFEVMDVFPGVSVTLRDVAEKTQLTVSERTASSTLERHEWLAARVVPRGASGKPEIEAGLLPIPQLIRDSVLAQLTSKRDAFLRKRPEASLEDFYKETPPFFHAAWVASMLDPPVPELANTDGEEMVVTRVTFEVLNPDGLARALDSRDELRRDGDVWYWSGPGKRKEPTLLGVLRLEGDSLVLESNSVQRGERGRALLETSAADCLRHRATTHENLRRRLKEELRVRALGGQPPDDEPPSTDIPREVGEALVLNHMARHYRGWLDEPVPALDGLTPRQAATVAAQRPKLAELIRGLEGMYHSSLRSGQPAYDPTWMWAELELEHDSPAHPPPLAHERVAQLVPGSGELARAVAEQLRRTPSFKDSSSFMSREDFRSNLDVQRLLRGKSGAPAAGTGETALAELLHRMVNFELHRRKSFWVDESLAYMLDGTDLDVVGREVRLPFPSFALVFTDRHVLSLAERMVSAPPPSAVSGHFLRVATVFVTEYNVGHARTLQLSFALDTLGADLPHLVQHEVPLPEEARVEGYLDNVAPPLPLVEPAVPDASPVRALFRIVINAILYATSTGVEPEARASPGSASSRPGWSSQAPETYSSDAVYFLPGAIEISQLRRWQELERIPDGRPLLRRFMVRGHWRRAAPTWENQRMRWVKPHWKGPHMATIIERTYKLKP